MDDNENQLRIGFDASRKLLVAIGDETRQAIISTLINTDCETGMRVGEITERTHLSRPAVSHHLKIMLDAELIGVNPKGTMNFYYIKLGGAWPQLVKLVNQIEALHQSCQNKRDAE